MAENEPLRSPESAPQESAETGLISRAISGVMGFIRNSISKVADLGKSLMGKVGRAVLPVMHDSSDIQGSAEAPVSGGGGGGGTSGSAESGAGTSPEAFERQYGQWKLKADKDGYRIVNIGEDGKKRFYEVNSGDAYKNPIMTAEPDRAFDVPAGVAYVDARGATVKPGEKIGGIICEDGPRFSLSSAEAPEYRVDANGTITIGSNTWHLATLFAKDKNRFKNYDAFFAKTKTDKVRLLELGDLPLYKEAA